jgi:adenylosuccinate lyase
MTDIWDQQNRFEKMLAVEVAAAQVQAQLGLIPKEAAVQIQKKSSFSVERILKIEQTTKHDVIAFVNDVAKQVGPMGRYVHFGLTSSDVLDTALSLQIRDAVSLIQKGLKNLSASLAKLCREEAETLCAGRTHGMHAEVTSFGYKMAGLWQELGRHQKRISTAATQCEVGKLSGAVGAYSFLDKKFEQEVCAILKLRPEPVATQVIPRDRHAELILSFSLFAGWLERFAVELRHLQRTEVAEVFEAFSKGQKGSSAMPHKKNPISAENLTGIARLLRSYAMPILENQALWHERDISHSSVERVIFPDAFTLMDYALDRANELIQNLQVDKNRMTQNMQASNGALFSSRILSAMVEGGADREEAYEKIQKVSHQLKPGESLIKKLKLDKKTESALEEKVLRGRFKKLVNEALKGLAQ